MKTTPSLTVSLALSLFLFTPTVAQGPFIPPSIKLQHTLPASVRSQKLKSDARKAQDTKGKALPRSRKTIKTQTKPNQAKQQTGTRATSTRLHYTAAKGENDKLRESLDNNPRALTQKDNNGYSLLHHAAREGQLETVGLLLERGSKIDRPAGVGETALYLAASKGHNAVVEKLIAEGANIDKASFRKRTPLHQAAFQGHSETVRLLLEAGADSQAKDSNGRTPLALAEELRQGDASTVIDLLEQAQP